MKKQYWIIDTDPLVISQKEFSATGPFQTIKAAESHILADTKNCWEDSCACLQQDKSIPWCKPLHIVQVIRTVQPEITANVKLVEVKL